MKKNTRVLGRNIHLKINVVVAISDGLCTEISGDVSLGQSNRCNLGGDEPKDRGVLTQLEF